MIKVLDNLISAAQLALLYQFCRGSYFKIGYEDTDAIENANHKYLVSPWSEEDLINSGFIDAVKGSEVGDLINSKQIYKVFLNLSTPGDVNFLHTHFGKTVVLAYVNLTWQADFGGETVFYNDDKTEVIKAVNVKPGRIVVFDGGINHSIRPQVHTAPHYRMTLAIVLEDK